MQVHMATPHSNQFDIFHKKCFISPHFFTTTMKNMFMQVASTTICKSLSTVTSKNEKEFAYEFYFGVNEDITNELWKLVSGYGNELRSLHVQPVHLLWTLYLLKTYKSTRSMAKQAGCTPNTFRKWVNEILERLYNVKKEVVSCCLAFSVGCFYSNNLSSIKDTIQK